MSGGFRDLGYTLFLVFGILFSIRAYELRDSDGQHAKENDAQSGQSEGVAEYLRGLGHDLQRKSEMQAGQLIFLQDMPQGVQFTGGWNPGMKLLGVTGRPVLPLLMGKSAPAAYPCRRLQLGSFMSSPPLSADSWARMPVQVMLADSTALG